jgi:uncharacterized protein (DUF1684 family)
MPDHTHDHDHDHDHVHAQDYVTAVTEFRKEKDAFFADGPESPIVPEQRGAAFPGLRYFAPDLAYRVEATVTPFERPETVQLGTTQGNIRPQQRFAELSFTLDGQACRLTAYAEVGERHPSELFVPFRDATSGKTSYGAGRYVEVAYGGEPTVVLDFNLAYSPWCAYNAAYTCIVPPAENVLMIAVPAGEQTYGEDHAG